MKYVVGNLVNNKWGNVDKLGYISYVSEKADYLTVVFFQDSQNEYSYAFVYFERYYKIL